MSVLKFHDRENGFKLYIYIKVYILWKTRAAQQIRDGGGYTVYTASYKYW